MGKLLPMMLVGFLLAGCDRQGIGEAEPMIVFLGPSEETTDAYLAELDGSHPYPITSSHKVLAVKWLDSQTIVVVSRWDIWLIDLLQNTKEQLTFFGDVFDIDCSPDGEVILFTRADWAGAPNPLPLPYYICSINRDSSNYRIIRESEDNLCHLLFIDQRTFLYTRFGEDRVEIRAADLFRKKVEILEELPIADQPGMGLNSLSALAASKDRLRLILGAHLGEVELLKLIGANNQPHRIIYQTDQWDIYGAAFLPGEEKILIGLVQFEEAHQICSLSLTGDSQPELVIEKGFSPDVWY